MASIEWLLRKFRRLPLLLQVLLLLLCFAIFYGATRLLRRGAAADDANDFLLARVRLLPATETAKDVGDSDSQLAKNYNNFEHFYRLAGRHMDSAMHWMDQMGTRIPLMRVSAAEESAEVRAALAGDWLRTQSLAVVATARNALPGLEATIKNLLRLCAKFAHCSLVFLENDSHDETRRRLHQLTRDVSGADSRVTVTLLGCGRVNSPEPCHLNVSYSTGKLHRPGSALQRNLLEEIERGQVMSALRNQLLAYAYTHLAANHSLLLAIDPDLYWETWSLPSVLQGLYYFATRPRLDSLCASSYYYQWGRRTIYDPCTLDFQAREIVGRTKSGSRPLDFDEQRSEAVLHGGPRFPVKVSACFQGLAFFRMAPLHRERLLYRKGLGEWICEHNTLSRQLRENYIDPNMQLRVRMRLGPLVL